MNPQLSATWTSRIRNLSRRLDCRSIRNYPQPRPMVSATEAMGGGKNCGQFVQTLWRPRKPGAPEAADQALVTIGSAAKAHDEAHDEVYEAHEAHDEAHVSISWSERRILEACLSSARSAPELLDILGYAMRTGNFKRGIKRLVSAQLLELTIPGKPRSKNQKYRLTAEGRA